jgi:hypothetical protein
MRVSGQLKVRSFYPQEKRPRYSLGRMVKNCEMGWICSMQRGKGEFMYVLLGKRTAGKKSASSNWVMK